MEELVILMDHQMDLQILVPSNPLNWVYSLHHWMTSLWVLRNNLEQNFVKVIDVVLVAFVVAVDMTLVQIDCNMN
jgi:hypothetical protein